MDPIEVTRADTGACIGYLCGRCSHSHLIQAMDGTYKSDASFSLAKFCCCCWTCKEPMPAPRSLGGGFQCPACEVRLKPEQDRRLAERQAEWTSERAANDARIAVCPDPEVARLLLEAMEEYSDSNYCASWLDSLEYILWRDRPENGRFRAMGVKCGGWWVQGQHGPRFVLMPEWLAMHERFMNARR